MNDNSLELVKQEGTGDDDDVDCDFYPQRNWLDDDSLNSFITLDHNYFQILVPEAHTAAVTTRDDNVVIKEEPVDFEFEDGASDMLYAEFGNSYVQPKKEVKAETADDFSSTAANSADSTELSDIDDFSDLEEPDDMDASDSEHSCDSKSSSDADEHPRKKLRVAFVVDTDAEESMIIDSDVWEDPKMHMTPVVELEDVMQIILAWQQNIGESDSDDIMWRRVF